MLNGKIHKTSDVAWTLKDALQSCIESVRPALKLKSYNECIYLSSCNYLSISIHSKYISRYDRVTVTNNEDELRRLQKGFGGYSPEMSKVLFIYYYLSYFKIGVLRPRADENRA